MNDVGPFDTLLIEFNMGCDACKGTGRLIKYSQDGESVTLPIGFDAHLYTPKCTKRSLNCRCLKLTQLIQPIRVH